ncbi:cysteine-rich domain-containing protein [Acrasis kona]|uniref:Cysteine-rich domain-containing protein n=1 Tax=Acrasis kona TaxID=1008807 RepID=A0AAW2ZIF1_9EUKA
METMSPSIINDKFIASEAPYQYGTYAVEPATSESPASSSEPSSPKPSSTFTTLVPQSTKETQASPNPSSPTTTQAPSSSATTISPLPATTTTPPSTESTRDATINPSNTITNTMPPTRMPIPTSTYISTPTSTPTRTPTPTSPPTDTATSTPTYIPTMTFTPTNTPMPTSIQTFTSNPTSTPAIEPIITVTITMKQDVTGEVPIAPKNTTIVVFSGKTGNSTVIGTAQTQEINENTEKIYFSFKVNQHSNCRVAIDVYSSSTSSGGVMVGSREADVNGIGTFNVDVTELTKKAIIGRNFGNASFGIRSVTAEQPLYLQKDSIELVVQAKKSGQTVTLAPPSNSSTANLSFNFILLLFVLLINI